MRGAHSTWDESGQDELPFLGLGSHLETSNHYVCRVTWSTFVAKAGIPAPTCHFLELNKAEQGPMLESTKNRMPSVEAYYI